VLSYSSISSDINYRMFSKAIQPSLWKYVENSLWTWCHKLFQ